MPFKLKYFLIYFLIINIFAGIVFWQDKKKARHHQFRTSEKILHSLEAAGGVYTILFLMYKIRHKNRKLRYYLFTYVIAILWTGVIGYFVYRKFLK